MGMTDMDNKRDELAEKYSKNQAGNANLYYLEGCRLDFLAGWNERDKIAKEREDKLESALSGVCGALQRVIEKLDPKHTYWGSYPDEIKRWRRELKDD